MKITKKSESHFMGLSEKTTSIKFNKRELDFIEEIKKQILLKTDNVVNNSAIIRVALLYLYRDIPKKHSDELITSLAYIKHKVGKPIK